MHTHSTTRDLVEVIATELWIAGCGPRPSFGLDGIVWTASCPCMGVLDGHRLTVMRRASPEPMLRCELGSSEPRIREEIDLRAADAEFAYGELLWAT